MKQLPPPVIPNWHPRRELSRPSAEQLSRAENRKQTLTYAGAGEVIPIVYGEQLVSGPIIAGPVVYQNALVFMVALCYSGAQGVERIEDVRLGDMIVPFADIANPNTGVGVTIDGITVRVLDGRQTVRYQPMVNALPGFDDTFAGIAVAYIYSPADKMTAATSLSFRVKGRKLFDPRPDSRWLAPVDYGAQGPVVAAAYADLAYVGRRDVVAATTDGTIYLTRYTGAVTTDATMSGDWVRSIYGARVSNTASRFLVGGESGRLVQVTPSFLALESGFGSSSINAVIVAGATSAISYAVGEDGKISRGTASGGPLTLLSSPVTTDLNAVTRSNNDVVIVGDGGVILSAVGDVVAEYDTEFEENFNGVALCWFSGTERIDISTNAANRMIAVGDRGQVAMARGGMNQAQGLGALDWVSIDIGFGDEDLIGVAYHESIVAVLSASGRIRIAVGSLDAWREVTPDRTDKISRIAAGPEGFILITEAGETLGGETILSYTENPALHMRDFVENTEFGMGLQLIGGEAAADACDSLYAGSPRARTGLCIQDQMTAEDALALFSTYAEVMYSFDGRNVSVIPDMVADTIHDIDASTVREGSIDLSTAGLHEIPTLVRVNFRDATDPQWSSRPAVARIPGGPDHGAAQAPSDVPLPGVYRRVEAERRAAQRLLRLQAPGRIRWQMFAPGLPFQAGDVVRMPAVRGVGSIRVRLTSQPEMVAPLLYQLGGEIYDESHYPQTAEGVALPQGAIVPYISSSVPEGHVSWSASGYIMGHATGGQQLSGTSGNISFSLGQAGEHGGEYQFLTLPSAADESEKVAVISFGGAPPSGQHAHSLAVSHAQIEQTLPMERVRWCKRTAEAGDMDDGVAVLADRVLDGLNLSPRRGVSGRYLAAGAPQSRNRASGVAGKTGAGGVHYHSGIAEPPPVVYVAPGDDSFVSWGHDLGSHEHSYSCPVSVTLKSKRLAMYVSSGEALLPVGSIVGWEDGAPPEGWRLCDGSNGTIDLRDYFVELSDPAEAGETAADTAETFVGPPTVATHAWRHGHRKFFSRSSARSSSLSGQHDDQDVPHTHPVSGGARSVAFMPPRRTLQFIQYTGE